MVHRLFATFVTTTVIIFKLPSASCFNPSSSPGKIVPSQRPKRIQPLYDPPRSSSSSHQQLDDVIHQDQEADAIDIMSSSTTTSLCGSPPYLALLTEPDACSSIERVEQTIHAIDQATADGGVNLVVVRVASNNNDDVLKMALLKNLAELKKQRHPFTLVVNDDVDIVLKALSQNIAVDGVHVKEYKSHLIPSIRSKLEHATTCAFETAEENKNKKIIIGTSCHSIESGINSYQLTPRGPDYLFVGTCYLTQSHPEKQSVEELEGPTLPGKVKHELNQLYNHFKQQDDGEACNYHQPPIILAIGGIDEANCNEPVVRYGADGVATIRTVMQSSDPRGVVEIIKSAMVQTSDRYHHAIAPSRLGTRHDSLASYLDAVSSSEIGLKNQGNGDVPQEFSLVVLISPNDNANHAHCDTKTTTNGNTSNISILLGKKLRGFGTGFYNCFGGKLEKSRGEHTHPAKGAVREVLEESGIEIPLQTMQDGFVGNINFTFEDSDVNGAMRVHLYCVSLTLSDEEDNNAADHRRHARTKNSSNSIQNPVIVNPKQIRGCDEIEPKWFHNIHDIPLDEMFADDSLWLTSLLSHYNHLPGDNSPSTQNKKFDAWFHFHPGGADTNSIRHYHIQSNNSE